MRVRGGVMVSGRALAFDVLDLARIWVSGI